MQSAKGDRFSLKNLRAVDGTGPVDRAKKFARSLLVRLYYEEVLQDFNVRPGQRFDKRRLPFPADAYVFLKRKLVFL